MDWARLGAIRRRDAREDDRDDRSDDTKKVPSYRRVGGRGEDATTTV